MVVVLIVLVWIGGWTALLAVCRAAARGDIAEQCRRAARGDDDRP